jgi:hypothetical protein
MLIFNEQPDMQLPAMKTFILKSVSRPEYPVRKFSPAQAVLACLLQFVYLEVVIFAANIYISNIKASQIPRSQILFALFFLPTDIT